MNEQQRSTALPTAADVDAAARRLAGIAVRTPLLSSRELDLITGARVYLKAETLQHTGSFKFRGAYNRIAAIPERDRAAGVVAYSSGNHAQGVAAAATLLGMTATIVMPSDAPEAKRARTRGLGAAVIPYLRDREDRVALAEALADRTGATLVPPFDDPLVIAGQGTVGSEIVEDLAAAGLKPEVVLVPASGGGLAAGVALAVKARVADANLYTVEPEGFDDFVRSYATGRRETNPRTSGTICDALMVPTPGEITFPIDQRLVGKGLTASDAEVAAAMAFAFSDLKLVVEPSGAIALAALLARKLDVTGKVVAVVLSGGNVDADVFARLIAGGPPL